MIDEQRAADHEGAPFDLRGIVSHRAEVRTVRERQADEQAQSVRRFLAIGAVPQFLEVLDPFGFRMPPGGAADCKRAARFMASPVAVSET